jgi:hypothetical protein
MIAKENGQCFMRSRWRYCPYYVAKKDDETGAILGYRCSLFEEDKSTHEALEACNTRYGLTYNGLPHS